MQRRPYDIVGVLALPSSRVRKNLSDPGWINRQIAKGATHEHLFVFALLAAVDRRQQEDHV